MHFRFATGTDRRRRHQPARLLDALPTQRLSRILTASVRLVKRKTTPEGVVLVSAIRRRPNRCQRIELFPVSAKLSDWRGLCRVP